MASKTVSTRLDPEELKLLEALGDLSGLDRSSLIKVLLRRGMQELRLEQAVAAYCKERVTLSRAAELAGMSLWDFLARMGEGDLHYDVSEFEADLAAISTAP